MTFPITLANILKGYNSWHLFVGVQTVDFSGGQYGTTHVNSKEIMCTPTQGHS